MLKDIRTHGTTPAKRLRRFFSWLTPVGTIIGILLFCSAAASFAQTNAPKNDPLLDLLVKKGFVTLDEAQQLRSESDAIKTNNAASFSKWKISDGIKSIELFGDIRLRYETRETRSPVSGHIDLDRFRYALRLGLRGDLANDFYYGLRLETSSNPRSPWVTFGTSTSGNPYQGPFGKSTAGIDIGQLFLGWHPNDNVNITVGKMANPLFTTPMVWDTDINPEGAAERFKYNIGPAEFFATFGQFLYQDDNPSSSTTGLWTGEGDNGHGADIPFLLTWQGGFKYQITKDISIKAAGTLYNYIGHGTNSSFNPNQNGNAYPGTPGFSDIYVGEGSGYPVGYSGYPSGYPNTPGSDGFTYNQTGINDLLVIEFPFEINFKLWKHPAKIFGDFAENLDGVQRAEAAVAAAADKNLYPYTLNIPLQKNQYHAYQFGFAFGNDDALGLVYGTTLKKGDWEARFYWQHIEQYALDPNLIDSDFFEGRGNLEGFYTAVSYGFTSSMIGSARYGYASRIDNKLGTGGSNQDIPQANPVQQFSLVQLDLTLKF